MLIVFTGCSAVVAEEDLIVGKWVSTAGFKDEKPEGESNCSNIVNYSLEFKDKTVLFQTF